MSLFSKDCIIWQVLLSVHFFFHSHVMAVIPLYNLMFSGMFLHCRALFCTDTLVYFICILWESCGFAVFLILSSIEMNILLLTYTHTHTYVYRQLNFYKYNVKSLCRIFTNCILERYFNIISNELEFVFSQV